MSDGSYAARSSIEVPLSDELIAAIDQAVEHARAVRPDANREDVALEALQRALLPNAGAVREPRPALGRVEPPRVRTGPRAIVRPAVDPAEPHPTSSERRRSEALDAIERVYGLRFVRRTEGTEPDPANTTDDVRELLAALLRGIELDDPTSKTISDLVSFGPEALVAAIADVLRRASVVEFGQNRLTILGAAVSKALRRAVLLFYLEAADWRLNVVADELVLHGSDAVLRMIRDLDLTDAYLAAKSAGAVRRGRPRKTDR